MYFSSLLCSIVRSVSKRTTRTFSVIAKSPSTIEQSLTYTDTVLVLSLILPSRQEICRFHLNLQTATVGQVIDEIKFEDAGVEHVQIYDQNGVSLAKSYPINSLMTYPFTIELNKQRTFLFDPIKKVQLKETIVRQHRGDGPLTEDTVAALYHALNVMKIYHNKYLELQNEANDLSVQLEPLEKVKDKLADICQRYTSRCIWYGLGAMSFQVGILAELTWDVYSWDIVEPISYFIAFGTAMSVYAFHLMTRFDFEFMTMTDRLFLRRFYSEAHRHSFDVSLYNQLKDRLFGVNTDLARLRAPLSLSLPAPPNPVKCKISGEELNSLDVCRTRRVT
ncbi:unnamed protein product [Rotaria magnacalcarata]|uniref:Calcium uniporter protein n=5 Tax=Rotaria magnacalcarata TaxID=392030 RepID=A0A816VCI3_9BILA|nr:unnamed protein product [Rotaria magnacalcarata]CAF1657451.1 unnamed protein product [Rotaria magnacalcarata]CAF2107923.1 unnamed protein product [Rotaria magnacalcarata]CAF2122139.1 unnamed protein product [Rotaria magnacalcarata]CAF2202876.1 unnamed protein product [Rotaria magnacalcarata]